MSDENLFELPDDFSSWDDVPLPSDGGGGITLPPGYWPAKIVEITDREPNKGGPRYVAVQMVVDGTDKDGTRFSDNLHLRSPNPVAKRIAASRVASLYIACDVPMGSPHTKCIGGDVIVEIRASINKATGQPNVNVHRYHSAERAEMDGIKIGPSGEVVPVRAAESPVAKAEQPKVQGKPWKR